MLPSRIAGPLVGLSVLAWSLPVDTHEIAAKRKPGVHPAWDIVATAITARDGMLVFRMDMAGQAGDIKPDATGKTAGAGVYAYVWPTSLDSSAVGFEPNQGTLAFTITAHPDFDDTPLADENRDGDAKNDGADWHSHWVVLVDDDRCGPGALKVRDIPPGTTPKLPPTWPGLPILIDSPNFAVRLGGRTVEARVPLAAIGGPADFKFDGVTAALRVNANLHDPLLCVVDVWAIASGDLSLPGRVGSSAR